MLSESTARLVDKVTKLGEVEAAHIKGSADRVPARRLLGVVLVRAGLCRRRTDMARQRGFDVFSTYCESPHERCSVSRCRAPTPKCHAHIGSRR